VTGSIAEEDDAMTSNCSLYRLAPLDPAVDPAYQDGPPPPPKRVNHAGELEPVWPVSCIPAPLTGQQTISLETLEELLECEARREERS
jgi:hypothetical protein